MDGLDIKCGMATVTGKGILFNGSYYSNATLFRSQLFACAESYGFWQIPVLFDVNDYRHIILWGSNHMELASTVEHGIEIDPNVLKKYQEEIRRLKLMLSMQRKH
ncbi:hypothetical protein [Paenibacillus sp. NEAU-GSW1]|uniref:hypothetical protein n=1 Tax=Paenibacillus sp. NEAU-GSW1 TaxID=2682486 RepID=UPI0012E2F772|nr:hypothetical protein [Paenibacillus sp. NEAU-GSW1]MUT67104.1 hypothetical protein [Paenibacillus sp. NEAU-GSW1]